MTSERAELVEQLRDRAGHARREGNCTAQCDARMFDKAADFIESQAVAGEAAMYQVRLVDINSGIVSQDWRETSKQTFDAVRGQPHQGNQLRCEYRTLYTTPQPASVDLLQIEAWLRTQRNNIPATGEEFADALRYCFITNANPTVPVDAAVKRDAIPQGMVLVQISDLKLLSNYTKGATYNSAEYLARQRAWALIDAAIAAQAGGEWGCLYGCPYSLRSYGSSCLSS